MSARFINLGWMIVVFLAAVFSGSWVAGYLSDLENKTLEGWQEKLRQASAQEVFNTAEWLDDQKQILQDITAASTGLFSYLQQTRTSTQVVPPPPNIQEAFQEEARLTYGLSHTYVFRPNGQLLLQQKQARVLPLKIRENLARAYQTGLNHYMFFSSFGNKTWFIASYRLQEDQQNLGYAAFMVEATIAMDALRNTRFESRALGFNLARRVAEADTFFVGWKSSAPTVNRFNIQQTNLPIFRGVTNTFSIATLADKNKKLVYVASIPLYPFWQHVVSVPLEVAFAEVRQTRFFYMLGYGILLLFLVALFVGLLRRVVNPNGSLLDYFSMPKKQPVGGGQPPNTQKPRRTLPTWQTIKDHATPQQVVNTLKSGFGFGFGYAMKARKLSDEEKERLKQKTMPPQQKTSEVKPPEAPAAEDVKNAEDTTTPDDTVAESPDPQGFKTDEAEQKQVKQIHECLRHEKYRLYFQPILETKSRSKVMFETLLRLIDDQGRLMQPQAFFPLAIKHGFVDQVDDMVIVASLRRHMEILTQGKDMILSINLSYGAFSSMNFMKTYQEGLKTGKLKPELLNFELSSREIIEDEAAMKFVREMQKSGANFSVDFFGDPEKSVQAAKKLKFDYMKVDCLKFEGLAENDPAQIEKFKKVIAAGKEHGLPLIVEKIETENIMTLCEKLDVPFVQGFYLAEPSPKLALGW